MGGLTSAFSKPKTPRRDERVVVITGCDTGFGNLTAQALDKLGYIVVAGCLTEKGRDNLQGILSSRALVVLFNVTKEADHERVVADVERLYPQGVYALIANAGISNEGPAEWVSVSRVRSVMEVNFFGVVSTIKSFLPGIHKTRGRIIVLASVASRLGVPRMAGYCASKAAVASYADSLRRELHSFGIKVVTIEPGFMKTPIVSGLTDQLTNLWNEQPDYIKARYGQSYFDNSIKQMLTLQSGAEDPAQVVKAIVRACEDPNPSPRQLIGNTFLLGFVLAMLPFAWTDWLFSRLAKSSGVVPAQSIKL